MFSTWSPGSLTLELVLVLIGSLLFPDQDLGGYVQADHARVGHQEEHDELLAHHPQRLVFPAVDGGWMRVGGRVGAAERPQGVDCRTSSFTLHFNVPTGAICVRVCCCFFFCNFSAKRRGYCLFCAILMT